ncbi:hypothetical protein A3C59_02515 [Candidatus Daviesbacteria bacterium RIFCSPHIGHO2_02_FULL_36_13]|uniref:Uncharacterized protein n=1 Tax=Candidatus Daviesbacteria bacterium RIFCSPHIGHO2_02_FULL_36_13 TaxID=1797768 RepID=A0A1F5JN45_9BACT|nr:MAG: hypothetical protein A3C59_02515 [Candidatus Daviesbacteria bacterium RIFCSPHIGHO2_02_FULL_36_13]OGE42489.1 MAG: hypothetical protein A3A45_00995 [Candidatus Daviesbacteria bacterium RIFCSPLOWO2_01_FULL_36_8]
MLKLPPQWNNLDLIDRKIIIAMVFDGSTEVARENLRLSKEEFKLHWKALEEPYKIFIQSLSQQSLKILRGWVATPCVDKRG